MLTRSITLRTAVLATSAALMLAACGEDPNAAPLPEADATAPEVPATAAPADVVAVNEPAVKSAQTSIGEILTGSDGMTLYAFTNDVDAKSSCTGTCLDNWPAVIVNEVFGVSPGLDAGIFATTERDDGRLQLVAGKWPLYLYAADAIPGDVTGQGNGGVWFAVDTSGALIQDDPSDGGYGQADSAGGDDAVNAATPTLVVTESSLGTILTDSAGKTLYLFTDDANGTPTCTGGCAGAWPPLLVDGDPSLPEGIDPTLVTTVEHPDGGNQLKIGKWPVYTFASDAGPGDTNGQGSGGKWFVVAPDGTPIR